MKNVQSKPIDEEIESVTIINMRNFVALIQPRRERRTSQTASLEFWVV